MMMWWIAGLLVALAWVWHVIEGALGFRRVARLTDPAWDAGLENPPSISIVVPARNEAHTIEPALRSLVAIDYPDYEVIVVNDRSSDSTVEVIERVATEYPRAPIRVIDVKELPPGWLGKTHAMWRGARESRGQWLLFTDADVEFQPDTLRRAMNYVERERADHLVIYPTMIFKSSGERMVMAFFAIMFGFAHKPWRVADPSAKDHIGMGAFNMVRRSVYEAVGTYERMRLAVIDDIKLGEVVKRSGYAQRAAYGWGLLRLHWASGAVGILHNLTKNFFAQLRYSWPLTLVAVPVMLLINLLPYMGSFLAPGWAKVPCIVALGAILLIYLSIQRETDVPAYYFFVHPIAALLVAYAVLRSAVITWKDGAVTWRGTKYSLDELRKGMG